MKITKIEVQQKNKNRVNLYIDDNFYSGLSLETIVKNRIKEGQEISDNFLQFLVTQSEKETALSKAVNYLSKSQKTKKQILNYLNQKGYSSEISNFVIKKLEEYSFLNDEIFAKNYIKSKNKDSGSRKIKNELKLKGVDEEIINNAIEAFADDRENIVNVAKKYVKNKALDLKLKQKLYRYLISRGYSYEDINFAIKEFKFEEEI